MFFGGGDFLLPSALKRGHRRGSSQGEHVFDDVSKNGDVGGGVECFGPNYCFHAITLD